MATITKIDNRKHYYLALRESKDKYIFASFRWLAFRAANWWAEEIEEG